ncbi:hypothetical protein FRC12_008548 [Ceratobasidium sp. 428]|nr:hypothetical protein FRC12_008548 [Ceratobasidium sp. 428]
MKVTTNVPGRNSRSNAKAEDFPLVAQMPANTQCTGGPNGDACVVRCRNAARAGPFGGCAAVTNAEPKAAPAAPANKRDDVSLEEAEAALAEDLERRDDVSLEEAEAALAEDLERRSFNKKRYLRTRVAGAKAGYWI